MNRPGLSLLLLIMAASAAAARAPSPPGGRTHPVSLQVKPADVGLKGRVRRGTWTPLRVTLRSTGDQPRQVICRWRLPDADGDTGIYHTPPVTLVPRRETTVWLYGVPPAGRRIPVPGRGRPWTVQVVTAKGGRVLDSTRVIAREAVPPKMNMVGICGLARMGLTGYAHDADEAYTQHEPMNLLTGLSLARLPDRWYGLSMLESLIWTADGGSPSASALDLDDRQALRAWVRRGGHLVIVLPTVGRPWTRSPLAGMLPVSADQIKRVQGEVPAWAGQVQADQPVRIEMTAFDVDSDDPVAVLRRDRRDRPVVIAGRYGFGRVTMVGLNFAAGRIQRLGLPNGKYPPWEAIFSWQAPVFSKAYIQDQIRRQKMQRPGMRPGVGLGQLFIPALTAMRETAGPAMLAAGAVFALYWLLAGPLGFALLKRRGLERYSWLAFLAVVGVFGGVSWGGAWIVHSSRPRAAHFSVLDLQARSDRAHVRSWLSLFMPDFGRVEVDLTPGHEQQRSKGSADTLASPGLPGMGQTAGFLDPRTYRIRSADPDHAAIPARATAKPFQLDYLGRLDTPAGQRRLTHRWIGPQGELRVEEGWPAGKLQHDLPGVLRNVLMVYCPGDGETPWVWRLGRWKPGEVLTLAPPKIPLRLVKRPTRYRKDRDWGREGLLGQLIGRRTGNRFDRRLDPRSIKAADSEIVQAIEMLTFFSALPPPNFRAEFTDRPVNYHRALGREMDLTPLTAGHRVILIGYLENSPLPVPLTVDGESVPADGWTVVRWIYDLDPPP